MAGQLTIDTLKASSGVLATQNGMTGIAKAWVNFNGTAGTIRSSFNVSSITTNSTGNYSINFTTAMVDANYAVCVTGGNTANANIQPTVGNSTNAPSYSTTAVKVNFDNGGGAQCTPTYANVAILGN